MEGQHMETATATHPTFKDARQAFTEAIAAGRLTDQEPAWNYAGHWMYMGTYNGLDQFKNINTRLYL
jgi:hypothetical protein